MKIIPTITLAFTFCLVVPAHAGIDYFRDFSASNAEGFVAQGFGGAQNTASLSTPEDFLRYEVKPKVSTSWMGGVRNYEALVNQSNTDDNRANFKFTAELRSPDSGPVRMTLISLDSSFQETGRLVRDVQVTESFETCGGNLNDAEWREVGEFKITAPNFRIFFDIGSGDGIGWSESFDDSTAYIFEIKSVTVGAE